MNQLYVRNHNVQIDQNFVTLSLETHLFFARIMKEHALFLMAGFPSCEEAQIRKADGFRERFEDFLRQVVRLSNGAVSRAALESGEVVTEFTERTERSTCKLTGISIDSGITQAENRLRPGCGASDMRRLSGTVRQLNVRALELVEGLIRFKEELLASMNRCRIFNANYPLLVEHILREARLYRSIVSQLQERGCIAPETLRSMETFWNQIMMEHAQFIRGLLDPTEEELIETAEGFAEDYRRLLCEAKEKDMQSEELTRRTLQETVKYRNFKAAGAKGISECEIRSIILPLLADHVLREANHYIRILSPMTGRRG